MTKIRIQNTFKVPLELTIEPWAELEIIPAGGTVKFECEGEDTEIEFSIISDNSAFVYVWSREVRMLLSDRVLEYNGGFAPK
jgi:hypothetical protein